MKNNDKNNYKPWGLNQIEEIKLTDIEDFHIGHAEDFKGVTGCTVIICEGRENAVTGVDVRGGLPGTRNTDSLDARNNPNSCNAILLSGGSYFGLNAVGGVEKFLEEKGIGYVVRDILIPSVAGAIIFDLAVGDSKVRPDEHMAYSACQNAYANVPWEDGTIGGGTGASVGKICGMQSVMKGGLGSFCLKKGDLYVGALMVVNAIGDVLDPDTSQIIAGALDKTGSKFVDTEKYIFEHFDENKAEEGNTTIGVIMTNAKLTKAQACKLAAMGQNGLARAIRPVHTMSDGDTLFTMATGEVEASMNLIEVMAVKAVEKAIVSAIKTATSVEGIVCYKDLIKKVQQEKSTFVKVK